MPQGSVLGPLLVLVYVNDIGTNIKSSISLFADDTILICSFKNPSALHTMLSNDLRQLAMWSDLWSFPIAIHPHPDLPLFVKLFLNDD